MNDYENIIQNKKTPTLNLEKNPFYVGDLKKDNSMDVTQMDKPSQVGHNYIDNNYYKQNEAYEDLANKIDDQTFIKPFDKAMQKDVPSNIESSKAINTTVKNSKGSVNQIIPELMSKVSENVDSTIDNVTSYFQKKFNSMTNDEIMNYAKISDALAEKAKLDTQMETDLLKAWSINKEMEYSLQGLKYAKDAQEDAQFYQTVQSAVSAVATVVSCVALFL